MHYYKQKCICKIYKRVQFILQFIISVQYTLKEKKSTFQEDFGNVISGLIKLVLLPFYKRLNYLQ